MTRKQDTPDLVRVSGRENLEPADRIGLLEADATWLMGAMPKHEPGGDYGVFDRANGSTVHAHNSTIGAIRSAAARWSRVSALPNYTPTAGRIWADAALSQIECDVLALRRGGIVEFNRVRRERWAREVGAC